MAFDFSSIGNGLFKILTSFLFWGVVLLIVLGVVVGSLMIRKKKKLRYPLIILTDLGAGKCGAEIRLKHGAGWFKSKTILFGLMDYGGEDVLRTWDKRIVQNASSEDFHEINGRRGLIVVRKSDDPAILLPINKAGGSDKYKIETKNGDLIPVKSMNITNIDLLMQIAPADYRDASTKLIDSANKETMGKWEKIAPYVVFGFLGIILLICIIFIVQMVTQSQTKASDLVIEAGKIYAEGACNSLPASGAAP